MYLVLPVESNHSLFLFSILNLALTRNRVSDSGVDDAAISHVHLGKWINHTRVFDTAGSLSYCHTRARPE